MSKRQEAVRLAKEGVRPFMIAHRLEISQSNVNDAIRVARQEGETIPRFRVEKQPLQTTQIPVPVRLASLLEAEATRREQTITETAQRLLEDALLLGSSRHR